MFAIMSEKVRRLLGLFLALTLVVGPMVQLVQASDMFAMMTMATPGEMPTPGGCSGCSGNDGMPMACSAICGGTISAILPTAPSVTPSPLASPTAFFITVVVNHHGPPDPYPPRPTSLG